MKGPGRSGLPRALRSRRDRSCARVCPGGSATTGLLVAQGRERVMRGGLCIPPVPQAPVSSLTCATVGQTVLTKPPED